MLVWVKGPVLQRHGDGISMAMGNSVISERSLRERVQDCGVAEVRGLELDQRLMNERVIRVWKTGGAEWCT